VIAGHLRRFAQRASAEGLTGGLVTRVKDTNERRIKMRTRLIETKLNTKLTASL
jgi:hypothetical protein